MNKYTFRQQIKNRGCFAEIVFDLAVTEGVEKSIKIDCRVTEWESICKSAAVIFYDYFKSQRDGRIDITVYEINWYPVDTNHLIVLFACVQAFNEATGISISQLKIDTDLEIFCFPEARSV